MKKLLAILAISSVAFVSLAGVAEAQEPVKLTAGLAGANEVGDAGNADGSGTAAISVDAANTQVCYDISVAGIDDANAAHIHSGGAGSNGDVVVDFKWATGTSAGCVDTDSATVAAILNTPELYYVNVHNDAYPAGAIRGQLAAVAAPAAEEAATTEAATTEAAAEPAVADTATEELAFTGDVTGYLAMGGAALVAAGAALVIAGRRKS